MSPGELESLRTEGEQHGLSRRETLTLLEHLDAVADQRNVAMSRLFDSEKARNEITADRDEARQEVAALRAQRDEIREAHRVEVAALIKGLGFVETGRDGRGSAPIYERGFRRVYAGGYDGWVAEASTSAGRSTVHFDGLGEALAYAVTADAEALTARLEAAERGRDELRAVAVSVLDACGVRAVAPRHAPEVVQRVVAKLAALVEAHDAWKRYGNPTSPFDLDEAIRAARGPA